MTNNESARESLVDRIDSLIDSLDEHVTTTDMARALGELQHAVRLECAHRWANRATGGAVCTKCRLWRPERVDAALADCHGETTRDVRAIVRRAVGSVLFNVSNFPEKAHVHLWGQDMGPLNEKITDAVLDALRRSESRTIGDAR